MQTTDIFLNQQLAKAQELLWGGSETENIEAHNIISSLIKHRMEKNSQGPKKLLTDTQFNRRKGIYKSVNILYNRGNNLSRKDKPNDYKA